MAALVCRFLRQRRVEVHDDSHLSGGWTFGGAHSDEAPIRSNVILDTIVVVAVLGARKRKKRDGCADTRRFATERRPHHGIVGPVVDLTTVARPARLLPSGSGHNGASARSPERLHIHLVPT